MHSLRVVKLTNFPATHNGKCVLVDKTNTHFGNWFPSLSLFITICCHQHLSHAFHSTLSTSFCALYSPSLTCQTQSYTFSLIEVLDILCPKRAKLIIDPYTHYKLRVSMRLDYIFYIEFFVIYKVE